MASRAPMLLLALGISASAAWAATYGTLAPGAISTAEQSGVRAELCRDHFVDPAHARMKLPANYVLLSASRLAADDPALAAFLKGHPQYASYFVGSLCFMLSDKFDVDGARAITSGRPAPMAFWWAHAERTGDADPRMRGKAQWVLSPLTLKNQNARHPINAMLNYAYTVLNGQVRIQIVGAGLDASIGMMHQLVSKQRDNLVLDLVEPLRPVVDQFIFGLALDEPLSASDFTIMANGACRLNPQMARTIATGVGALLRSNPIRADLSPDAAVTVGAKVRGQLRSGYVHVD